MLTALERLLLDEACRILGWQGGTIHQVFNVLSAAKFVVDTRKEAEQTGEWDKVSKSITALESHIYS